MNFFSLSFSLCLCHIRSVSVSGVYVSLYVNWTIHEITLVYGHTQSRGKVNREYPIHSICSRWVCIAKATDRPNERTKQNETRNRITKQSQLYQNYGGRKRR